MMTHITKEHDSNKPFAIKEASEKSNTFVYEIKNFSERKNFFCIEHQHVALAKYPEVRSSVHSNEFYFMLYFSKGEGEIIIDYQKYYVRPNTLFFICPGQLHKFDRIRCSDGINIAFSVDFLNNLSENTKSLAMQNFFSYQNEVSVYCFDSIGTSYLENDFQQMLYRYENSADQDYQINCLASLLALLMMDILHYGSRQTAISNTRDSKEYRLYVDFMECVEQDFKIKHATIDYVHELSVSLSTLNKYVMKASGKSPSTLIDERIILEAKRMLFGNTDIFVKEVAHSLGFEDTSNFVKFFKRYTGMSPTEFRDSQ